jgi:hypothetical protein
VSASYGRDPRVGRKVHLRHVKGEREVTRALDGTPGTVVAVWKYAGGLVRIHVLICGNSRHPNGRKLTVSTRQVEFHS